MAIHVHLREALAAARDGMGRLPERGVAFWLVAIVLVLVLPSPVALAVIAARLRRRNHHASTTAALSRAGALGEAKLAPGIAQDLSNLLDGCSNALADPIDGGRPAGGGSDPDAARVGRLAPAP